MTAQYIRDRYGVPAKRGMHIEIDGKSGVITGFDGAHLRVRMDGDKGLTNAHPTWRVVYKESE